MMRTIFSLGMLIGVVAVVATGTNAFFGDTESATGNTFAAGAIDLMIDNESYYNGAFNDGTSWDLANLGDGQGPGLGGGYFFFHFLDLKPDDEGEDTISIHVDNNDAWACMNVSVTDFDDNGCNEPEAGDGDDTCGDDEGELQNEIEFVWWADDGDNVLEDDEDDELLYGPATLAGLDLSVALADSSGNGIFGPDPLVGGETYYIGKAWCFGDLTLAAVAQDGFGHEGDNGPLDRGTGIICDGTDLDNMTQTDSVMGEVSFTAVQARHNDTFLCAPFSEPCVGEEAFADNVVDWDIGERNNGTAINGDRTDPTKALGAPQSSGDPYDNPVPAGEFFSLGFDEGEDLTPDEGGWIIVEFTNNVIVDGPGNDLRMWEITGGSNYPIEKLKIEVSQDGVLWLPVASSVDRDAEADLADSGLSWARFVRLTDVSERDDFGGTADGYDLDAFSALNCAIADFEPVI